MRVLEDLGFYCVDNLPVALAEAVMRLATSRDPRLAGVALSVKFPAGAGFTTKVTAAVWLRVPLVPVMVSG